MSDLVVEGNLLARRMAQLARIQHRLGRCWSIENPAGSYMWDFAPLVDLAKCPGVIRVVGHQCCFGAEHRKETAWLTNAPWVRVLDERCPGPPAHPRHPALTGRAVAPDGSSVWATALAAEYPEGLCNALAHAYAKALATQPRPPGYGPAHHHGSWSGGGW